MSHAAMEFSSHGSGEEQLVSVANVSVSEEGEHYRTSGFAVLGMGALAFGLYALTVGGHVTEGFIDANGVLAIACLFISVGTYMVDVLSVEAA